MKANPILHSGAYLASAAMCFLVAQSVLATTPPPAGFIDASTYGGGYNTTNATAALQAAINTGQNVLRAQGVVGLVRRCSHYTGEEQSGGPLRKRRDGHSQAWSVHGCERCLFDVTGSGREHGRPRCDIADAAGRLYGAILYPQ